VVHSQVYVTSSVLIVDDRVAVVGGAGVSDQSLQGVHDSNISILVEDTTPVSIQLGGRAYEASKFAHTLRMNLMRHHVGDHDPFSEDLSDISSSLHNAISGQGQQTGSYESIWLSIANRNAEAYSSLDGDFSLYNIKTLEEFKQKHVHSQLYVHKSEMDAHVQALMAGIQGFLVPFPLNFDVS
jgi:phospholipase D1/2